ncbi:MAG: aspartate aminotransferase family protein [Thiogranum sp.]
MTASRLDIPTLQHMDAAHHLHPFCDNAALAKQGTRIITRAEGVYVWDAEGNKLLDAFAGLWCVNVGYGRQELVEAAARQMRELPYYNSFFQCTSQPTIELAELITSLAPDNITHAFFTGSGSEANDTILRMVRHFWSVQDRPERFNVIGRYNGYHGSTVAGASLGGMPAMHKQGGLPIPGIYHINQPYWFEYSGDLSPDDFGLQRARELEEKILELGPETVAAFIAEPIQGAGGVIIPPASYWPEIQRICRKYDVLLIVDEVICGFGRTGKWFGCDFFDIQPDIMPVAKGISSGYLPIGAVMFSERIAGVLKEKGGELAHGYTYSGHPVCAAVALENIRILQREHIVETVDTDTGPYLQKRWLQLADHPLVGEARIAGFVGAIELVPNKPERRFFEDRGTVGAMCRDFALANGLILRATKDSMLLSPPLVMTHGQIDELIEKTRKSLDQTWEAVKART